MRRQIEIFTLAGNQSVFAPVANFPSIERQDSFSASIPYVLTGLHFSVAYLANLGNEGVAAVVVGNGAPILSVTPNSGVVAALNCTRQTFAQMDDFISFSDGGILIPPNYRVSLYFGASTGGASAIVSTACLYMAPALDYGQ